jgi:hypothetical protein
MNKFQKAVQKRNAELENAEKSDNKLNNNPETSVKKVEESQVKEKSKIPMQENEQDNININLSNLFPQKEKKAKNKTFYLDESVISAIEKQAKKQKVSDSKFLNEILKQVFRLD